MQKRSRRPHGIGTRKISVSVAAEDLKLLTARARRDHRGNVSAVLHDLVDVLRREQAMDRLLDRLGADRIPEADVEAAHAELFGPRRPTKRRGAA